jgi:hypothetical protein
MKKILVLFLLVSLLSISAQAATVTLVAADGFGQSSFNSGLNWSDSTAPGAGNDYVDSSYRLRTPADGGSYTFGGDSLTIQHGLGTTNDGFCYKGTGSSGSITVDDLILDGGQMVHINGSGDIFNLYGNVNILNDSAISPRQGPINVYSVISGSAQLTVPISDSASCKLWIHSSANTFTGDIVNQGRFGLVDDAILNFVIGASGVNNDFDGTSHMHATFDGDFVFDLTSAGTTVGDSWTIIDASSAVYWGDTFTVQGFSEILPGAWVKQIGTSSDYHRFDESTGVLQVVPEPATMMLLGLGSLALIRRRKA